MLNRPHSSYKFKNNTEQYIRFNDLNTTGLITIMPFI